MFNSSARSTLRSAAPKLSRSSNPLRNFGSFRPAFRNTSKPWAVAGSIAGAATVAYTLWEFKPEMMPSREFAF